MAQIGLADTLKLLAAGYKKKDIEALASVDSASTPNEVPEPAPDKTPEPAPEASEENKEEVIDYKAILEQKSKELEEMQKKLEKLQKANTQKDSAPAAAEAKQKEAETLTNLVRGFM